MGQDFFGKSDLGIGKGRRTVRRSGNNQLMIFVGGLMGRRK